MGMSKSASHCTRTAATCAGPSAEAAHHDAGEAPVEAVIEADDADVDVALLEDAVLGEQCVDVSSTFGMRLAETASRRSVSAAGPGARRPCGNTWRDAPAEAP